MRAVRRSPLFRIALLILAVLFAHTARASTQPILPVCPPRPCKVAAAQPDSRNKLRLASTRVATPPHPADHHHLFTGAFALTAVDPALLFFSSPAQLILARGAASVHPQRRPFALRI